MAATRMPAIVDRLGAIMKEATGLQIIDGPHIGELMDEAIVIGFTESADRPGYQSTITRQPGYGAPSLLEEFTVRCLLTIASGDTDIAALRNACGGHLNDLAVALAVEHVAEDVWERAALGGDAEWLPLQGQDGAAMSVIFTVEGACLL